MYRPSKYNNHNDSLESFSELFNQVGKDKKVSMIYNREENYSDDGKIIIFDYNKEINYDWEKRFKYFNDGHFTFKTLGQFERKFHKDPRIGLTIQCDTPEKYILVALHSKFQKKEIVSRTTDTVNEIGGMRTTGNFIIYSYDELDKFIAQLISWAKDDLEDFYDIKEE